MSRKRRRGKKRGQGRAVRTAQLPALVTTPGTQVDANGETGMPVQVDANGETGMPIHTTHLSSNGEYGVMRERGKRFRDVHIVARAIREQWPISDEMRPMAVSTLKAAMEDELLPHRDRIMAVKALATLNAQNMAAEAGPAARTVINISQAVIQAGRELAALPEPSQSPQSP